MSWYPGNNFQFPPPGWFPNWTNCQPSSPGTGYPLPGHGFQSACPPLGGRYFGLESFCPALPRMQYPPSAMFYNTAQYPPTFIASPTADPLPMQQTEQYNEYYFPPTNNNCARAGESMFSTVRYMAVSEGNTPTPGHPSSAQAYVMHGEQGGQQQNQQEHERWEEERPPSFRQRQGQEKSKPDKTNNQSVKGKQITKQITNQSDSKQWTNHSDVGKNRGVNAYGKMGQHKQHKEEIDKYVGQQQSWGDNPEKLKSDPAHGQSSKQKYLETPRTQQHSSLQRNAQSEITQRPSVNRRKGFSESRTYHNTNSLKKTYNGAHITPLDTKHKQHIDLPVTAQFDDKDRDVMKSKNYTIGNPHNGTSQTPSHVDGKKHRNTMNNNIQRSEVTHSPDPIAEFSDLRLNAGEVILDKYSCDLNAEIGKGGYDMTTLNFPEEFRLLYAGAKANVGISKGRAFFEAKITRNLMYRSSVSWDEAHPNVARIGWSDGKASLELGKESMSFGYGSSGKFSTNDIYRDYGESFTVSDVIGALIDLDSKPATISFMKNGKHFGIAQSFPTHSVDEKKQVFMFPHVYIKNCQIALNFGQDKPWFSPPEGYKYIGQVPPPEITYSLTPQPRKPREVIMTVGLPGAGKTTWAKKKQQENPEKKYYILGTDHLIDKMRVTDLPRSSYSDRFDKLYPHASKCYEVLLDMAARSDRNYILDQTNVFHHARERKITRFSGFRRIAVVIQPCDQELERRAEERTRRFGKIIPRRALLEMKKKYSIPSGPTFHEITYSELGEQQARALVMQYNRATY